jgi:hypothetical protein
VGGPSSAFRVLVEERRVVDEEVRPLGGLDGRVDRARVAGVDDCPAGSGVADHLLGFDDDPGEFELDDDEREEIEEEFGTDFSTGTEVGEPGEADIETPDPDPVEEDEPADHGAAEPAAGTADADPATETAESADAAESDDGSAAVESTDEASAEGSADESAEDVALEDAVMDAMNDLDDGDGADRETLIEHVADRTGADPDAVEDAVQDAMMSGKCYEPTDGTLKAI